MHQRTMRHCPTAGWRKWRHQRQDFRMTPHEIDYRCLNFTSKETVMENDVASGRKLTIEIFKIIKASLVGMVTINKQQVKCLDRRILGLLRISHDQIDVGPNAFIHKYFIEAVVVGRRNIYRMDWNH